MNLCTLLQDNQYIPLQFPRSLKHFLVLKDYLLPHLFLFFGFFSASKCSLICFYTYKQIKFILYMFLPIISISEFFFFIFQRKTYIQRRNEICIPLTIVCSCIRVWFFIIFIAFFHCYKRFFQLSKILPILLSDNAYFHGVAMGRGRCQ